MRNNLLDGSQVRNVGWVDDEGKRGTVSEMRQDLLNYCQVRDDGCVDEDAGGAVSEVVKGPRQNREIWNRKRRSKAKGNNGNVRNERLANPI